jgi:protein ImuA
MPPGASPGDWRSHAPDDEVSPSAGDRGRLSGFAGSRRAIMSALPRPDRATLSELFAASPRDGGATGFLLPQLDRARPLLWVQERMAIVEGGRIYPPGLGLCQLIHVEVGDARAALWAMEEGLRCSALGGVIGELWGDPRALDFTATRRLAVAAERSGVPAWLLRFGGRANLSGARMRWRVASAPSVPHPFDHRAPGAPAWDAELFRARGVVPARWEVALDPPEQANPVDLAAATGNRTLGEGERLRA